MLRHLSAGDRDEALDGDLLEVFRLGRSNAWYWRQVSAACLISWWDGLQARGPALVFALVWSMLAPVWYGLIERIEALSTFDRIWQMLGPLWLPIALVGWIALHATFLWAGLAAYRFVNALLRKPIQLRDMRRAFWIAALVFPPVAGLTFLVANLYWYSVPGLAHAKLAATPLRQIADLGLLADFIRFPYFVAMTVALWGTILPARHGDALSANSLSAWASIEEEPAVVVPMQLSGDIRTFLVLMVVAGFVNSMIAAFLLCRLPDTQSTDISSLFANALLFVAIGASGGILGSWLYWKSPSSPLRESSPVPFPVFALTCAAGWVWVPAMVLLGEQVSAGAAFVAMIGAFVLAMGLKSATCFLFVPSQTNFPPTGEGDLFAESLHHPRLELHGYLIALGLFAAGAELVKRSNYTAAALLAMSAFVFAWKRTVPLRETNAREAQIRRAMKRVAFAAVPAILLTMGALLIGMAHRNEAAVASAATTGDAEADKNATPNSRPPLSTTGPGGYQSVVLWPYPDKKEIEPPIIAEDSPLAPGSKKPLIIRFDGPYWFMQPPSKQPGREAHVAHGTPVNVDLESNNAMALVMDAHQRLSRPIPTGRCREIEIGIENRDNRRGMVSLGVLLTDDSSSPKRTLYLGQQSIVSTEPENFFVKTAPVFETVRFAVPPHADLRKFNEITVMFLPDIEHTFVAPKIAIQQFAFFPR